MPKLSAHLPSTIQKEATLAAAIYRLPLVLYLGLVIILALPTLAVLSLTSGMSPMSHEFYMLLGAAGHGERTSYYMGVIAVGFAMTIAGYIVDIAMWRGIKRFISVLYQSATITLLLAGFLGCTPSAPCVPILVGIGFMVFAVVSSRRLIFSKFGVQEFSLATGLAFQTIAVFLVTAWVSWAFSPLFGGYNQWRLHDVLKANAGFRALTTFVIWASPAIMSAACLLIAIFTITRSRFHVPDDPDSQLDSDALNYLHGELKSAALGVAFALLSIWVAASLAAEDLGLSHTVLRLGVATFFGVTLYLCTVIGFDRIIAEAESSALIRETEVLLASDWSKGLLVLLCWPLFPLYVLIEAFHQSARDCSKQDEFVGRRTVVRPIFTGSDNDHYVTWLAWEARGFWASTMSSNWASVLTKAIHAGLIVFGFQVGTGQLLPLFLSWLNETIATWSMMSTLVILFITGISLFMIPAVPGLPIYLLTGIIVTERFAHNGYGFHAACISSVVFSYILKMTACFLQMKLIGGTFSRNVKVKKTIGVHTPTLKAIRCILSKPGFARDKVAVLCGGPDWPTYVVSGILGSPVAQTLIGGSPVILMIVPMVLTTAFTTKALHEKHDPEAQKFYQYVASIMAILSSLILLGFMTMAGYYIQALTEEKSEEIASTDWMRDPQEKDVLQLIAEDDFKAAADARKASWRTMPCWLRSLLALGVVSAFTMTYTLLLPTSKSRWVAFRDFKITDRISDLPGGSPLAIVRPMGWLSIACFFATLFVAFAQSIWASWQIDESESSEDGEEDPLLPKSSS